MALTEEKVVDISLLTPKQRFRIDGDNNRILELDVSDMSIINRINTIYPKLNKLTQEAAKELAMSEDETVEEQLDKSSRVLTDIDQKMRRLMDELFDANVSEVCVPFGTMYDLRNGMFTFERIIEVLGGLYEANVKAEVAKLNKRISNKTSKYTKR